MKHSDSNPADEPFKLTVRGIEPDLAKAIQRMAREEGISLNQAALRLLAKGANLDRQRAVIGHDLDHLFGTWKPADAESFLDSIRSCEQVDEGFWK